MDFLERDASSTFETVTGGVLRMRRHLVLSFQCPLNSRTRTDRIKLGVG